MRNYFSYLGKIVGEFKILYLKSFLFILVITVIQVFIPLSMRWIITNISEKKSISFFIICILGYSLFLLISNISDVAWYKYLDYIGGHVLEFIRTELFLKIKKSNYESILTIGKERIKNILYTDVLKIFSMVTFSTIQIISNITLIMVLFVISFFINYKISFILIIMTIIGFLISMFTRESIKNASRKVNEKMKIDNEYTNEFVDSIELIKTNNLMQYYLNKGKTGVWDFISTSIKADNKLVFFKNINTDYHTLVSLFMAAFLSTNSTYNNSGDIVFYLFITNLILNLSSKIENLIYSISRELPSFENIDDILNLPLNNGTDLIESVNTVRFDNVSFKYQNSDKIIIRNADYTFTSGDIVKVQGGNGGGKSTFLKLLMGLLSPTSGNIFINNIDIKSISQDCLINEILYIDQDELIINGSISNYLNALTDKGVSLEKINDLKNLLNLNLKSENIQNNGKSLSGGQRKKLLMMKLLLLSGRKSIVIIDELEAGLDVETKSLLINIEKEIFENNKNSIIFKISHEKANNYTYNKVINF